MKILDEYYMKILDETNVLLVGRMGERVVHFPSGGQDLIDDMPAAGTEAGL